MRGAAKEVTGSLGEKAEWEGLGSLGEGDRQGSNWKRGGVCRGGDWKPGLGGSGEKDWKSKERDLFIKATGILGRNSQENSIKIVPDLLLWYCCSSLFVLLRGTIVVVVNPLVVCKD